MNIIVQQNVTETFVIDNRLNLCYTWFMSQKTGREIYSYQGRKIMEVKYKIRGQERVRYFALDERGRPIGRPVKSLNSAIKKIRKD